MLYYDYQARPQNEVEELKKALLKACASKYPITDGKLVNTNSRYFELIVICIYF